MGRFDERRTGDRPVTGGPFGREDATSELVAALRRRERELATLAANTPDPIARYDRDLRLRYVNPATVREAGRPREAIVGRTLEEAFPELAPAVVPQLRRVLAGEGVIEVEFEFLGPGGARTWHSRVVPELDDAGAVVGILAVSRDVTARRRIEEALRASEQRFRALVENGTDFIAILDEQGTIRYASPSHERLLGLPPEALVGRLPFALVHPDDVEPMKELLAAAMRGPTAQRTFRMRDARGNVHFVLVALRDLRDDPAVGGIVANSRDVTEQLRLEERLRQSQRLEALGQLAGGVAHDFNNILASVLMYAQSLAEGFPPGDPRRADAEEIANAAMRGAAVAKQLLAFGRAQPMDLEVLDLGTTARDTGRMLRALLPASIQLELPPAEAPPLPVRASRAGIAQILLNLAVNARDAMPEGGAFVVSVQKGEGGAVLRARDTGRGIPPEIRDRIFDPFFTTKPLGEGTGLGLATVYGLVRQFGGTIAVSAGEPIGTTFEIVLPLADPRVAAPPEQRATAAAPPTRAQPGAPARRVLVAEDEPPIARVARRILERAGYDVTVEGDGRAALERLRRGDRFDVVLTDAAMPVMSGWQLADEIARLPSPPPVVLMSGYAEHSADAGRRGGDPTARPAGFLQKPFTNVELLAAVERVTARGGG